MPMTRKWSQTNQRDLIACPSYLPFLDLRSPKISWIPSTDSSFFWSHHFQWSHGDLNTIWLLPLSSLKTLEFHLYTLRVKFKVPGWMHITLCVRLTQNVKVQKLRGTSLDASPYPHFPTITRTQFKSLCFGECPLTLLGLTGVCLCWPSLMHRFCVVAFLPLQVDVCSGI